ncbi:DUF6362 family protein [Roseibium sp. Sym1]|uniref:DUF6362 family protein n=1 Tax=Roseibium sp. Sym1 TaxID=3016006 RepID=UPI0022B5E2E9|nr:DUF6362 family protein [Roseibium sp. Sym1]
MTANPPQIVMDRLIEAVDVIAATGKRDGPKAVLAAWPDYRRKTARRQRTYSPREISRAEEAITWFSLVEDPEARRALQFEVMCKAGAGKFSRICDKYGWKRSTVTSRNRAVLKTLAERVQASPDLVDPQAP